MQYRDTIDRDQKDGLMPPISASHGSDVERVSISLK